MSLLNVHSPIIFLLKDFVEFVEDENSVHLLLKGLSAPTRPAAIWEAILCVPVVSTERQKPCFSMII